MVIYVKKPKQENFCVISVYYKTDTKSTKKSCRLGKGKKIRPMEKQNSLSKMTWKFHATGKSSTWTSGFPSQCKNGSSSYLPRKIFPILYVSLPSVKNGQDNTSLIQC